MWEQVWNSPWALYDFEEAAAFEIKHQCENDRPGCPSLPLSAAIAAAITAAIPAEAIAAAIATAIIAAIIAAIAAAIAVAIVQPSL